MTGREGPGPERPGPDYPPEWDREPAEEDATCAICSAAVWWVPGPPPGRPELTGGWQDEAGGYGVRGPAGHRHQP